MAFILHFCLLFFPIILPNAAASSGSHHSRRYAAYDYDLTTPQYTPDGRLLQVEYATNACIREGSNPIVGVGISIPGDEENLVIMATISSPPSSSSSTMQLNPSQKGQGSDGQVKQQDEKEMESIMKDNDQRAQFRIIEVPLSASYRQTSTILIGLSGLLSDATSLLQIAYSQLEEEQRMFGWHRLGLSPVGISTVDDSVSSSVTRSLQPSPRKQSQSIVAQPSETVLRLSRAIADECQKHAFGGGLRPFGASLLLAGGDNGCQTHGARVAMCETHPNGGWRSHVSTLKSDDGKLEEGENTHDVSTNSPQIMVSGGPVKSQYKLKSLIQARLRQLDQKSSGLASTEDDATPSKNNNRGASENSSVHAEGSDHETLFLRQALHSVISSLVEEWGHRGDPLWSSSSSSSVPSTGDASKNNQSKYEQGHLGQQQPALPLMEVVIASPKRGTVRLTQSDIARLMRPTSQFVGKSIV